MHVNYSHYAALILYRCYIFTLFHQMNGIALIKHKRENMTMNKIQAVYTVNHKKVAEHL